MTQDIWVSQVHRSGTPQHGPLGCQRHAICQCVYAFTHLCTCSSFSSDRITRVHDIGYWDNAIAYDGRVRGWGHVMQEHGHRVESIGKLHYVNDTAPTGFSDQT